MDPQTLQWFRFLSPERLSIDIENRRSQEEFAKRKTTNRAASSGPGGSASRGYINEKIKVEGLKRKKRRMRLKAKNQNEMAIEKFVAQSSKSAKYAKTTVKKRDTSTSGDPGRKVDGGMSTAAVNMGLSSTAQAKPTSASNNASGVGVAAGSSTNYQTTSGGGNQASGAGASSGDQTAQSK